MHKIRFTCAILFLLLPLAAMARDIAVVTEKTNPSANVNAKDLIKLLRRETVKWADGTRVQVFLTDPASADSRLLREKTYGMSESELKTFAGHKEIAILASDEEVLKAVAQNPGAIGVINVYSINSAVKVLKVDGKLPLEQGYLLHGN